MRRNASILDVLRAAQEEQEQQARTSSEPTHSKKSPAKSRKARREAKSRRSGEATRWKGLWTWFLTDLSMPRGGFYIGVLLSLVLFFAAFELGVVRGRNANEAGNGPVKQANGSGVREPLVNQGDREKVARGTSQFDRDASRSRASGSALVDNPSGSNDRKLASERKNRGRVAPDASAHAGPWLQILSKPDDAKGKGRSAMAAVKAHLDSLGMTGARIAKTSSTRNRRGYLILVLPIKAPQNAKTLLAELRRLPNLKGDWSFNFAKLRVSSTQERATLPN